MCVYDCVGVGRGWHRRLDIRRERTPLHHQQNVQLKGKVDRVKGKAQGKENYERVDDEMISFLCLVEFQPLLF